MKKILSLVLVASMTLSLAACGAKTGSTTADTESSDRDVTITYISEPETLDYLVTSKHMDQELIANFVDGLYENTASGAYVPALAESYEVNKDATVYTYKIKKGIKWVTATGEEYGEVKAQDWVTAAKYAVAANSDNLFLLEFIKNMREYMDGKVTFEEVGVKALDDYTLEYTMAKPTPFFHSMTTYCILFPLNAEFLASQGEGCALEIGKYDKEKCNFGIMKPDSILYNGCYVLSVADAKSKYTMKKNAKYWDKDNVHFSSIVQLYDDGKDPYTGIKGFENNVYQSVSLRPTWQDYSKYLKKYQGHVLTTTPNSSAFGINFNYNRVATTNTNKDAAGLENTHKAILNKNFRTAILHAFDRVAYMQQSMAPDIAVITLRNMNGIPDLVTTSDGTQYGDLVSAAYQRLTNSDIDLSDGQDPFLNPELAMEYIKKAEAEGVKFPVTIDLPYISDGSEVFVNRAKSFKSSIEANTQGKILVDIIAKTKDEIIASQFNQKSFRDSDFDVNLFSGWGPDYADPKSFTDIYSNQGGAYMKNIGFAEFYGQDKDSDAVYDQTGWGKYQELIDAADKIVDDLDARYKAYAEADAYLIAEALFIPQQMQIRGKLVSKFAPFQKGFSYIGTTSMKWKFIYLTDEMITEQQFAEAYTKMIQDKAALAEANKTNK